MHGAIAAARAHKGWEKEYQQHEVKIEELPRCHSQQSFQAHCALIVSDHFIIVVISLHCSETEDKGYSYDFVLLCYDSKAWKARVVWYTGEGWILNIAAADCLVIG